MSKSPESVIARLRKERGMSQQQLADQIGAHWITISKLERGKLKLTYEWSQRIATALNVSMDQIFNFNKERIELNLIKSIGDAGSVVDNKYPVPEDPDNTPFISINDDFLADDDSIWCIMSTNEFYPIIHDGDIVRFTYVNEGDLRYCIGRVCLVKERGAGGREVFGILSGSVGGPLSLTRPNGAPLTTKPFEVTACMTITVLSPAGLGLTKLQAELSHRSHSRSAKSS